MPSVTPSKSGVSTSVLLTLSNDRTFMLALLMCPMTIRARGVERNAGDSRERVRWAR